MANKTLDKAVAAIPKFGKRIKLFTEKLRIAQYADNLKTDIFPHNNQITFSAAIQLFA